MKLKHHAQDEMERRLQAIESQFVQQDRITRAAMLTVLIFGAAVLAIVGSYLVCASWILGR
jgi:1,4-dihydroxy-2-naphthoate octaprenyltransferase